jgi:hypothetical protein
MTENATWSEEYPAHDLWSIEKSLTPMSPEEEREAWATTVKVLDGLCMAADGLCLDPLLLALADAITRAREELARVEDRLSRPPIEEGEKRPRDKVHPREDERLIKMLRLSDGLSTASRLIEKYASKHSGPLAADISDEVAAVQAASEEAHEHLESYRREVTQGLA